MKIESLEEKLTELRERLQVINQGANGTKEQKIALFQAVESERRTNLLLHKLNSIEANLIAELRALILRAQESNSQVQKPRERRWFWKKKKREVG